MSIIKKLFVYLQSQSFCFSLGFSYFFVLLSRYYFVFSGIVFLR